MRKNELIKRTHAHIREFFAHEGSGHDYWHAYRVWKNTRLIAQSQKCNLLVAELAALLHDIADRKFTGDNPVVGRNRIAAFLKSLTVDEMTINAVCAIAGSMSFSSSFRNGKPVRTMETIEGKIVQDADRLDALGAIGIARAFAYGGSKARPLYEPKVQPRKRLVRMQYTGKGTHTINHFHEKLLVLKGLMNTAAARKIARKRHAFMKEFLRRFHAEWNGETG